MKIRDAINAVEESKEIAARIFAKVFGIVIDYCEDTEAKDGGMIWYNFKKYRGCGGDDWYSMEIPDEVMTIPHRSGLRHSRSKENERWQKRRQREKQRKKE